MARSTLAVAIERLPKLKRGVAYQDARQNLVGIGWLPVTLPNADECMKNDYRCQGRPEMLSCSGTGLASCAFTWRRGDTIIAVITVGESDPSVFKIVCRIGCK